MSECGSEGGGCGGGGGGGGVQRAMQDHKTV